MDFQADAAVVYTPAFRAVFTQSNMCRFRSTHSQCKNEILVWV